MDAAMSSQIPPSLSRSRGEGEGRKEGKKEREVGMIPPSLLPLSVVVPPSLEVLKNRLVKRGKDSSEVIERRLKQAEEEISHWKEYRYMVVNDDLAEAYDNMRAIILAERHRISNRAEDRYE